MESDMDLRRIRLRSRTPTTSRETDPPQVSVRTHVQPFTQLIKLTHNDVF